MESLQTCAEKWTTEISTLQLQLIEANRSRQEEMEALKHDDEQNIHQLQEIADQQRVKEKWHAENESLLTKRQIAESDLGRKTDGMDANALRELELHCVESVAKARNDTAPPLTQLQQENTQLKEYNDNLRGKLHQSEHKLTELKLRIITDHLQAANSKISSLEQQLQEKQTCILHFEAIETKLLHEKHVLNEIRCKLHDKDCHSVEI